MEGKEREKEVEMSGKGKGNEKGKEMMMSKRPKQASEIQDSTTINIFM